MYKQERVRELLLSFLSEELRTLRDPRLQTVSFTEVQVSKDCKYAVVFWSAFTVEGISAGAEVPAEERFISAKQQEEIGVALSKAGSLFRRRIADELELRVIPNLQFKFDETAVQAMKIDALLSKVGL